MQRAPHQRDECCWKPWTRSLGGPRSAERSWAGPRAGDLPRRDDIDAAAAVLAGCRRRSARGGRWHRKTPRSTPPTAKRAEETSPALATTPIRAVPVREVVADAPPALLAIAPSDDADDRAVVETIVAAVWTAVLPDAALTDASRNFLDLGGSSLRAMDVAWKLETIFGLELGAADVFDHPTVSALADMLLAQGGTEIAPIARELLRLVRRTW